MFARLGISPLLQRRKMSDNERENATALATPQASAKPSVSMNVGAGPVNTGLLTAGPKASRRMDKRLSSVSVDPM